MPSCHPNVRKKINRINNSLHYNIKSILYSYLIELVETGTKFDQQSHDVRVTVVGGNHQRRVVLHVRQVNICPPSMAKE